MQLIRGVRPPKANVKFGYDKIYESVSSSIAQAASGIIPTTFNENFLIYGLNVTASAGGTAVLGHRDAFTMQLERSNQQLQKLVSEPTLGAALLGSITGRLQLIRPWYVSRGETLLTTITNTYGSASLLAYVSFFGSTVDGPPPPREPGFSQPIYYSDSISCTGSSGTATAQILVDRDLYVEKLSAGVAYGSSYAGTAAINGRDGFKFQAQRQNTQPLTTGQSLATSVLGLSDPFWKLEKPWFINGGETIDLPMTNLSANNSTFFYVFHCRAKWC